MAHVVSRPSAPFRSHSDHPVEVHQIPSARDNLTWLVVCVQTGDACVVDGPDAGGLLDYCEQHGIRLTAVLNTHTHGDHVGVNRGLRKRGLLDGLRVVGPARAADGVPGITERVDDGDVVQVGAASARVFLTEGHIDGHVSFVFDDVLFCGDTMFGAGCGYLFDGPPEKMHDSLQRLAALPPETRVCCAHEYTQDNLRFAWSVEPDNPQLAQRIREAWALRAEGGCTVPSTIEVERQTNPFLRHHSATLQKTVAAAWPERVLDSPAAVFAATRALKDRKDYRQIRDDQMPL